MAVGEQHSGVSISAPTYDAVPYSVGTFAQSGPDRLGTIGRIFGMTPAPPNNCIVLELGCASGGNLIPMALLYPNSRFVGIDLSQRQIEEGVAVVNDLKLTNVELKHLSILDVSAALGTFDYIIAHGVYSWVPPAVQEKTLSILRDHLNPGGIGYISYNTYPGWHLRSSIRDILLFHVRDISDPTQRLEKAREVLEFFSRITPNAAASSSAMAEEMKQLLKTPDTYLMHEYLDDFNLPLHFHEFVRRAGEKNLQYLAEADASTMSPMRFGAETVKSLQSMCSDRISLEQNMDFLRHRMFRQTLLCHAQAALTEAPQVEAVREFFIASALKGESAVVDVLSDRREVFADPGRPKIATASVILKAGLMCLSERWPLPTAFTELIERVGQKLSRAVSSAESDELAEGLLNSYMGGVVEFSRMPPAFVTTVSERPAASPYARLRAATGNGATNMRLENLSLTDASRTVLCQLDGTHDRNYLTTAVAKWLATQPDVPASARRERAARYVDYILPIFAKSALLIA
jgi:methyltransferase-like protein